MVIFGAHTRCELTRGLIAAGGGGRERGGGRRGVGEGADGGGLWGCARRAGCRIGCGRGMCGLRDAAHGRPTRPEKKTAWLLKKGGAALLGRKKWQRRFVVYACIGEFRRLAYYKSEAVRSGGGLRLRGETCVCVCVCVCVCARVYVCAGLWWGNRTTMQRSPLRRICS